MGCDILDGGTDGAALYCTTTGWTVGPLFHNKQEAEDFLRFITTGDALPVARFLNHQPIIGDGKDPRDWQQHHLEAIFLMWRRCRDAHQESVLDGRVPFLLDVGYDRKAH